MKKAYLTLLIAMILFSCQKEDESVTLLINVSHEGHPLSQAAVYLKKGHDTAFVFPPLEFNEQKEANAKGQVYFENLASGLYTIWARGFDPHFQRYEKGVDSIRVGTRQRVKEYNLTIETQ
jgi:hypothetical protein